MLFVGLIHIADPSYGADFLRIMSSVYPGADTAPTLGPVLLGALYGFVDGGLPACCLVCCTAHSLVARGWR